MFLYGKIIYLVFVLKERPLSISHIMDESQDVDETEQWKLHKCVFDNDLQTLSEALKSSDSNLIDKKVKFSFLFSAYHTFLLNFFVFQRSLSPPFVFTPHRISMATRHFIWQLCWVEKVSLRRNFFFFCINPISPHLPVLISKKKS